MAAPCRFDAHVAVCSQFAGAPVATDPCEEPAAYTAIVEFGPIKGMTLRIDVEVCEEHNRRLSAAVDYQRSIKLRAHTTT